MAWIWIISTASAILFVYILQGLLNLKQKLPPGPRGLPIIGHFHLFGTNPHKDLHRLAQKYGPIMYTRFGHVPVIIVSSSSGAELFLKTHDLIFANRGHIEAGYYLAYQQKDIAYGNYTPYWRAMRKLVTLELLSNRKIAEFQEMRSAELGLLVDSIKQSSKMHKAVDLSTKVMGLNGDMTCLMVFGRKYADSDLDEKGFKTVLRETMDEAGNFNIGDYFPYLRGLDLQGSTRRLKNLSKIFDGLMERIIDEHVHEKDANCEKTKDFVDTMMTILKTGEAGFDFDRHHVKAVLQDMLLAGMDTSSSTVEWTLSELIKHPAVMKKLQNELEQVVGMCQMVEESHLTKLSYLHCVLRESLRLHPPAPFLIHESMEDCVVDGFTIPNKSKVIVNVWAIGRDTRVWVDPEVFSPERFIGSNIDLRGHDFELIPFGSGRRGCPGLQSGLTIVQLTIAQLIHCFDWELPDGMLPEDLDMTEHFGLVITREKHLMAIPKYKLSK